MPQLMLFMQLDLDSLVAGLQQWHVIFQRHMLQIYYFNLLLCAPTEKVSHLQKAPAWKISLLIFTLGLQAFCPSCPQLLPFQEKNINQNKWINQPKKVGIKYVLQNVLLSNKESQGLLLT